MKMIYIASIIAVGFVQPRVARAEVKPPGTVVTSQCATKIENPMRGPQALPKTFCLASVAGYQVQVVTIDDDVWQIGDHGSLQLVGTVGEREVLQLSSDAAIVTGKMEGLPPGATVVTAKGIRFVARDFQTIYHTQGVGPQ